MAGVVTATLQPQQDLQFLFGLLFNSPLPPGYTYGIQPVLGYQSIAYAAAITPDPTLAIWTEMAALTGPVTVNVPVRTDNITIKPGTLLGFKWIQDATGGRVVTYTAGAGGFRTGGAAAFVTTLSTITLDLFLADAAGVFRILYRMTGQAI